MGNDENRDELMTTKEVASMLRVEPRTVHRWIALGRVKPLRIGRTIRFSRASVIRSAERYEYGGDSDRHDPAMG